MRYDTIIVGAGSAGCVLAARLSEDPDRSVLLLEAGPGFGVAPQAQPPEILDANDATPTTYDWGHQARLGATDRESPVFAGRILGGSSATNNVMALRGHPADYDDWNLPGWTFDDVLPAFRRVERDLDFGSRDWHGTDGPVPVRRYSKAERTPAQQAFLESCTALGQPWVDDHNAPDAVGAGPLPLNELAYGSRRRSPISPRRGTGRTSRPARTHRSSTCLSRTAGRPASGCVTKTSRPERSCCARARTARRLSCCGPASRCPVSGRTCTTIHYFDCGSLPVAR
jgi:choline dehydrogenase-like flavoprotein